MATLSASSIGAALVQQAAACELAYDVAGANRAYKSAVAADPDNRDAYLGLGGILLQVGRTEEAVTVFTKACERWPGWIGPRWAAVVARIPQFYSDAAEIVRVRANYVAALQEMRARAAADIAGAIQALGTFPPFQIPYQGYGDRILQTMYGDLVTAAMGAAYPHCSEAPKVSCRPGEPIRVGIVCGTFCRHSVWPAAVARLGRKTWTASGSRCSATTPSNAVIRRRK